MTPPKCTESPGEKCSPCSHTSVPPAHGPSRHEQSTNLATSPVPPASPPKANWKPAALAGAGAGGAAPAPKKAIGADEAAPGSTAGAEAVWEMGGGAGEAPLPRCCAMACSCANCSCGSIVIATHCARNAHATHRSAHDTSATAAPSATVAPSATAAPNATVAPSATVAQPASARTAPHRSAWLSRACTSRVGGVRATAG
jgi:hypothetical protein